MTDREALERRHSKDVRRHSTKASAIVHARDDNKVEVILFRPNSKNVHKRHLFSKYEAANSRVNDWFAKLDSEKKSKMSRSDKKKKDIENFKKDLCVGDVFLYRAGDLEEYYKVTDRYTAKARLVRIGTKTRSGGDVKAWMHNDPEGPTGCELIKAYGPGYFSMPTGVMTKVRAIDNYNWYT